MIWRLLICFSLTVLFSYAGEVKGTISITETARGKEKNVDPTGTVVWLDPVDDSFRSILLKAARHESTHYQMVQKNKSFTPHVLAIPIGSTVDFPNFDPIFHNAFSNYNGQIFDIGLYPPGTSRSVTFSRPGIVRIFCNIHASMSAVIAVLQTPFFTVVPADGTFVFNDVPEGKYQLSVYSEHATEKAIAAQTRIIEVRESVTDLGLLPLDGSAFLNIPHLNKYGKEYGSAPDPTLYPGGRQ